MTKIREGELTFSFSADCEVGKYDDWRFYRDYFQGIAAGTKAVDVVCVVDDTAWLVEIKDYSRHWRTKTSELPAEVAQKVRDTLAGLAAAAANATSEVERGLARKAIGCRKWRVVLHLEEDAARLEEDAARDRRRIRPRVTPNVADKLRRMLKAVDPDPWVLDRQAEAPVPWTVA